jgi:hypothetical protein
MTMTEAQMNMFTTMHDSMFRRLNGLEMLHKGGQRAVDKFTASGLHGLEKRKANALQKAKRANPNDGGGGGGGAAMATRPGIGLGEQGAVSLGTRHPLPRRRQARFSTSHVSSSSSPRGLNVESATNWATGQKIAVQVSTTVTQSYLKR